ncbi:MAG: PRC-barrel domain-containing protein [Eubacterium sp.]
MRIDELKRKEVINSCTCKILGCADDIEFDICTGCIKAIIVPGPGKWCGLICSEFEFVIPFQCITQVGPDIILVKVNEEEVKRKIKIV